jgi:hypothetical protein
MRGIKTGQGKPSSSWGRWRIYCGDQDLKNNPFRIWDWMSSGIYFPPQIQASVGLATPELSNLIKLKSLQYS